MSFKLQVSSSKQSPPTSMGRWERRPRLDSKRDHDRDRDVAPTLRSKPGTSHLDLESWNSRPKAAYLSLKVTGTVTVS